MDNNDSTIFNSQTTTENSSTPPESKAPAFQLPQEVNEFVGEGKKYSSVEDALRSVPHAQTHIQKLENELKELREQVTKAKTAEEILEQIKSTSQRSETPEAPVVDESKLLSNLDQLLERKLQEKETQRSAQQNIDVVTSKLSDIFGEKAEEVYVKAAAEAGVGVEFLNSLSAKSPSAVFKLMGLDASGQKSTSKSSSSVNTEAFKHNENIPAKSVMRGASTKEILDAWRRVKPQID